MKRLYPLLRNTHLLLGLFTVPFLLTYGVSSIRFAHRSWVSVEPEVNESSLQVSQGEDQSPRALARILMKDEEFRGVLHDIEESEEGFDFRIARIGTLHEVSYDRHQGVAKIRTSKHNLMGILVWLHVQSGVTTPYWLHNLWGVLVVIASAALLILGLTGIYLWFKIYKERIVGSILLALSLGFGLFLILAIRIA